LHPPVDLTHQVVDTVSVALSAQALSVNGPLRDVHLASLGLGLPRIHRGLIASGDQFVNAAADCDTLRHHLPGVLAVEMEGAAVAQVCHDFGVPYVVLRTISDRADESAHIDFSQFVRAVACRYALTMIEALLRQ
jgi:adenosylhomocysteine nucleosidase